MTRRKLRKLLRIQVVKHSSAVRRGLPVASALLACMHAAYAADPSDTATLEEVVVTAQKRTENLQDVPISIQALNTAKLEELHIPTSTISRSICRASPSKPPARVLSTPIYAAWGAAGAGTRPGPCPG